MSPGRPRRALGAAARRVRELPGGVATLLLLLAAAPGAAKAEELRLSLTETVLAEARGDNKNGFLDDDGYGVAVSRFNVVGTAGDLVTNLRLDITQFGAAPTDEFENDLRLERITARYRLGRWTLVGGDFFDQLGRGIMLSVRKVDELGVDVSIRGAELSYGSGGFQLRLFGGFTNPANLDAVNQKFVRDTGDAIAGLSTELDLVEGLRVGAHALYLEPEERLLDDKRDWTAAGGLFFEWHVPGEVLVVYGEGDFQGRRLAGGSEQGYAGYLVADLGLGDYTVLVEGLYLQEWEIKGSRSTAVEGRFDYNKPPTLERIDQEVLNNRDVVGGRVRLEASYLEADLLLHVNGMLRLTDPTDPGQKVRQIHGFGGVELAYQEGESRISVSGGYRTERQQGRTIKTMTHAEADWIQALSPRLELHMVSYNELRTLDGTRFERGSLFAGIDWSDAGGLTFELGYDTQDPSGDVRNFFYAGILVVYATERIQVRATGGTQRGGLKCISGVCRFFPAFAGGRAELIGRF